MLVKLNFFFIVSQNWILSFDIVTGTHAVTLSGHVDEDLTLIKLRVEDSEGGIQGVVSDTKSSPDLVRKLQSSCP